MSEQFKTALGSSKPLFGHWVGLPDPSAVEVMSRLPCDFLLLDGEHAPIAPNDLYRLLPAADLHARPVVFRPRSKNEADIKAALDAGVAGVMVPMVETAQQARAVVETAYYAPKGKRGVGPLRASNYYDDFGAYLAAADAGTLVIVQIESADGLANADAIAAIDGVDALFVGPADMAQSLKVPIGDFSGALLEACATIAATARRHGKCAAMDLLDPADAGKFLGLGFTVFTHGSDFGFLQEAGRRTCNALRAAFAAAGGPKG